MQTFSEIGKSNGNNLNKTTGVTPIEILTMTHVKEKTSSIKITKFNSILWYKDPFVILSITSMIFFLGTVVGGVYLQTYLEDKIIPTMIDYTPFDIFVIFYITSIIVHVLGALAICFRHSYFIIFSSICRFAAIIIGLATLYISYADKDELINKVAKVWEEADYELTVSFIKEKYQCCGWNITNEDCSIQRCYNSIYVTIDEISRWIGIGVFCINAFQTGLFVNEILMLALGMTEKKFLLLKRLYKKKIKIKSSTTTSEKYRKFIEKDDKQKLNEKRMLEEKRRRKSKRKEKFNDETNDIGADVDKIQLRDIKIDIDEKEIELNS
ncbi:hypothetical protein TRFO_16359 [Tritrichomonas foetus]|uniref:Tetraspanin family protein n=1 Tax=Tritrichomonas foetus TaxID=1144522 RepID=A0A1J4KQN4_9EUKA|nr:hypothetical protein TRFO_16359 [Tritrichomonas foetus]|eukprot:OHT13402.1 hypothetical protein TRFO_16359 [Tritrichomonas foetus]